MTTSDPQTTSGTRAGRERQIDSQELPPTLSVEQAGELVGVGRNAAYRAAHRGDRPWFRVGRKLRAPTAQLLRLLSVQGSASHQTPEEP
jgi:excisionase family DNA binding protein